MRLMVQPAEQADYYKDMARVHSMYRGGLTSGTLARITVENGGTTIVAVRGLDSGEEELFRADLETRRRLKIKPGVQYEFTIRAATYKECLQWAIRASDPAARVATWIALWSFGIGIVLGVIGLLK